MAVSPTGRRRRLSLAVAILAALLAVFGAAPAHAEDDPEGGNKNLREKLEAAAKGYYDAKNKLVASQKRQGEITKRLRDAQISLVRLTAEVTNIASARYKGAQIGVLNGLFTGQGDPETLLQGAA